MSRVVLDASALLAFFKGEPGAGTVAPVIPEAVISAVNYAEVATRLFDYGVLEADVRTTMRALNLEVVPLDEGQSLATASLRPMTRHLGLSLGTLACLALAKHLGIPALTADRAWAELDVGVPVQVIR